MPSAGQRRRLVEVAEGLLRLVVDEVGELLGDLLPVGDERDHRRLALDRALLAGEAGDVAARRAVGPRRVDEGALAVVRAEVADRLFVVLGRVIEVDGRLETDERRRAAALDHAQRLERGAQRAGLAGVGVDEDLGAGDALLDVVDLRLDRREVVLRAALEHVARAQRGEPRDLHHVLPDVLGQHLGEAGEKLLLGEALLLEVDAIGVEEDGAAVAELGRELGAEGGVGVLGHRQAELVGHRLEEHAVAGGARVGEAEVGDVAVLHEQDLDVLPADVADDVDLAEVAHRAHHVGDGLDDVHVGAHRLFEHVGRVAGGAEAQHLQRGALV